MANVHELFVSTVVWQAGLFMRVTECKKKSKTTTKKCEIWQVLEFEIIPAGATMEHDRHKWWQ